MAERALPARPGRTRRRRPALPRGIAARLLVVQLAVLLVVAVAATAALWSDSRQRAEQAAADRSLAVATTVADSPRVAEGLASADPTAALLDYSLDVTRDTGVDFVTIMDRDTVRVTHPDPDQIGRRYLGTTGPALAGRPLTETFTGTLGPSVRAVVPVRDAAGGIVGLVSAGVTVERVSEVLGARLPGLLGTVGALALLLAAGAVLLSRSLERTTWGLGPEEMARMLAYYESVLHSVGEGIVLVDRDRRLVLHNDQAAELLDLDVDPTAGPVEVAALGLPAPLERLLAGGTTADEVVHLPSGRVLVVTQRPALPTGRTGSAARLGTVTTLRDRTEVQRLSGEVATLRTLSDAMRAQTHEFANRLHTIVSLIELERPREALALAASELETDRRAAAGGLAEGADPVVQALVRGKTAQAAERGVELAVRVADGTGAPGVAPADLVTIVGNLVDNAIDAAADPSRATARGDDRGRVELSLARTDDGALLVEVADDGPGVDPAVRPRVLEFGVTTKPDAGAPRGVGLALVARTAERLGGTVEVGDADARLGGARFRVVLPADPRAGRGDGGSSAARSGDDDATGVRT
ncbi:sensor histidine kinase [Clavibacter sp. CT19]|uniref:sensor histidine kinase n=1 Tax=Clavibacter sp. CT19 TaxID=3018990 RepID=UPI0022EA1BEF|nr:sensor histidine kinase [Clavibacter sp. CT19]MDA3805848.1 sensor histidine kinase [Clavibacter sp. CT19]